MKKIVGKLNKNRSMIIGILIGTIFINLIGVISSIAASTVQSNIVLYDSVTGKKNVKDAIDELYTMSSTHCPTGYTCIKNGLSVVNPPSGSTYFAIVYLDPTDLSKECNASNSVSITGTKTGCMKWYAYRDNGTTYDLILDHNTTATVPSYSAAQIQVNADTSSWVRSLNPRNITADEVYQITKSTNGQSGWSQASSISGFYFEESAKSGRGTSKYPWLYDYTDSCTDYGCNISDNNCGVGYWTQNTVAGSSNAWSVNRIGYLNGISVNSNTNVGVRPVITISKS